MKDKRSPKLARLLIILVLVLLALTTFAVGKYMKTMGHSGTVSFTARLASNLEIWEHQVQRNGDGTYSLDRNTPVHENAYVLIPGLDVAKDPYVLISGKTDIPAYLYVEIVTATIDSYAGKPLITYTPANGWKVSDKEPLHGGTVYEYVGNGDSALALTSANTPKDGIYLLADNKIYVSQHAKYADNTQNGDTDVMQIYAYLVEVTE